MNRNTFEVLYYLLKNNLKSQRQISRDLDLSIGTINKTINALKDEMLVDEYGITVKGKNSLSPYKVKNAIIMAAGMSSRFVPLSYETPKGLLEVKEEIIIERQIRQLREVGINDITVVVGYMKEKFFYLEEKYDVKIAINSNYNTMNNPSSLLLVKDHIENSYICSSDNYFSENVFEEYVYSSYYASNFVNGETNEYCISTGSNDLITKVQVGGKDSWIMIGHVYWDVQTAKKLLPILETEFYKPGNQSKLWEDIYMDYIKEISISIKKYPENIIFEFDNLQELRDFDEKYVKKTNSKILANICKVLKCDESDILNMEVLSGGLTNASFIFEVNKIKYVYRHPGVGTEEIINRKNEATAQLLAKKYDIDPTFIYMDECEGWKISLFIENAKQLDYESKEEVDLAINLMQNLHNLEIDVDFKFDLIDKINTMETIILEKKGPHKSDYLILKEQVFELYNLLESNNFKKCLVHNDCYDPNFIYDGKKMYLIDWEYAASFDIGGDIGTFICCSPYSIEQAKEIIKQYLGDKFNDTLYKHLIGYVSIMSFYWYVWALYKEACGEEIGEFLLLWYRYTKQYLKEFHKMNIEL